jgi:hypothetical protein
MININAKWRISAAAFVAAASIAGCNGEGGITPPSTVAPGQPPQVNDFSFFAQKTFAADANSTPVSLDGVTFTFDVNNDPGAFDSLIMPGTYQ